VSHGFGGVGVDQEEVHGVSGTVSV
jgi:hypothetical protein